MSSRTSDMPAITIAQVGVTLGDGPYAMTFALTNAGDDSVSLVEARLPHAVLRADAVDLTSMPALGAGATTELAFDVTYQPREDASEPSNPFVILLLMWRGEEWRVLAQLALVTDARGAPTTTTAVLSAHRVGSLS
jgi:hypothetical protein